MSPDIFFAYVLSLFIMIIGSFPFSENNHVRAAYPQSGWLLWNLFSVESIIRWSVINIKQNADINNIWNSNPVNYLLSCIINYLQFGRKTSILGRIAFITFGDNDIHFNILIPDFINENHGRYLESRPSIDGGRITVVRGAGFYDASYLCLHDRCRIHEYCAWYCLRDIPFYQFRNKFSTKVVFRVSLLGTMDYGGVVIIYFIYIL